MPNNCIFLAVRLHVARLVSFFWVVLGTTLPCLGLPCAQGTSRRSKLSSASLRGLFLSI